MGEITNVTQKEVSCEDIEENTEVLKDDNVAVKDIVNHDTQSEEFNSQVKPSDDVDSDEEIAEDIKETVVITSEEKISTDEIKAAPAETVESDEELTPELEEEKFTAVKEDDIEGGEIKACAENDIKPKVTEQTSTEKETEKSKETTSEKEFVEESNTKVDIKLLTISRKSLQLTSFTAKVELAVLRR